MQYFAALTLHNSPLRCFISKQNLDKRISSAESVQDQYAQWFDPRPPEPLRRQGSVFQRLSSVNRVHGESTAISNDFHQNNSHKLMQPTQEILSPAAIAAAVADRRRAVA